MCVCPQAEGEASVVQSAALVELRTTVGAAAEWEGHLRRALAKKGASADVATLLDKVRACPPRLYAPRFPSGSRCPCGSSVGLFRPPPSCSLSLVLTASPVACVQVAASLQAGLAQVRGITAGGARLFCACQQEFEEAGNMIACDACDQW